MSKEQEQEQRPTLMERYSKAEEAYRKVRANLKIAKVILTTKQKESPLVFKQVNDPFANHSFSLERSVLELENALRHAKLEIDKLFAN